MEFKERIKILRLEKDITQAQLAVAFDKSESAIRTWESGKFKPDADTLIRLAEYFGCSIDYMLGLSDYKHVRQQKEFNAEWEGFFGSLKKIVGFPQVTIRHLCMWLLEVIKPDDKFSILAMDKTSGIVYRVYCAHSILYGSTLYNNDPPAENANNADIHLAISQRKIECDNLYSALWKSVFLKLHKLYPLKSNAYNTFKSSLTYTDRQNIVDTGDIE